MAESQTTLSASQFARLNSNKLLHVLFTQVERNCELCHTEEREDDGRLLVKLDFES